MIPDFPNILDEPIGLFRKPHINMKSPLIDYARGGENIGDASKGLDIQDWKCEVRDNKIYVSSDKVSEVEINLNLTEEITWISLAFDQNMGCVFAYTNKNEDSYITYYDTTTTTYINEYIGNVTTPIARMDNVKIFNDDTKIIIISYIKNNSLCVRLQSDRYQTEYVLAENIGKKLRQCGMADTNRFQWAILKQKENI